MVNHMNSSDNSHQLFELKSYLDKTDQYRKQSFNDNYPAFADIFSGVSGNERNQNTINR